MILAAFSLKKIPFAKNIQPKDIFYNQQYQEMKSRLHFMFENMGIGLFTGEVGTGKSTMVRITLQQLNNQLYKYAYLYKGLNNLGNFYMQLALAMGIMPKYRASDIIQQVTNAIAELHNEQKIKTIIIIDEAHLLKPEILDEIRLIHNNEMDSTDYLATILLGQPALKKMMTYMKYRPLAQRIAVSHHLEALQRDDAYKYFEHHLKIAGAHTKIFLDNAVETIINAAKGIPRVINNVAVKSMYAAVNNKMTNVDQECVMMALDELGLK